MCSSFIVGSSSLLVDHSKIVILQFPVQKNAKNFIRMNLATVFCAVFNIGWMVACDNIIFSRRTFGSANKNSLENLIYR